MLPSPKDSGEGRGEVESSKILSYMSGGAQRVLLLRASAEGGLAPLAEIAVWQFGVGGRVKKMISSVFWLVGLPGKATTDCGPTKIFKNLRFEKQGIGRGGREYGVNIA